MTNFANTQAAAARNAPDRPAIRLDDQTLTYRELDRAVAHTAGLLRAHGVGPGDRVGMQLPNVPYFPIVYWAGLRLGAVTVPMNPLLKSGEFAYHLCDAGAKVMLGEEVGAAIVLKPGATSTPDDLREFVKSRVAAYKYPREVWLVEALPKGPTGKILKREIDAQSHS